MSQNASPRYLNALNGAQLQAVTHDPAIPIQILAGPGSGKTRVLTSRVAHLVQHHKIPPSQICAVTFTNKAANEMRERLKPLIGDGPTRALIMGTFHAICGRYLRKYGSHIKLSTNFSICDADESKKIIQKLLKMESAALKAQCIEMKDAVVQSAISKAKSKATSPADLSVEAEKENDDVKKIIADIYENYEQTLTKNNSLDFDDLLLYGVKLFKAAPHVLQDICHILVDEFQDTSVMQYDLVKHFAKASMCVSIVGDPDQSIYGWRAAEIENLNKMRKDFPTTEQIFLEQSYRSTGSILAASHAIVAQDRSRINKGLHTSHAEGTKPVLRPFSNEHEEADFIADEIRRLVAYSGGMLGWGDFAVLLRYNALSRPIESSFQRLGIPLRMLAGHKFFDRAEIKDILAYLQLVDNVSYNPAFHRVANVPRRSIGDKSIQELITQAQSRNLSCMEYAERLVEGRVPSSTRTLAKLQKDLPPFVRIIKTLRKLSQENTSVPDLIQRLLELTKYQEYLKKCFPDADSRWENVQELVNFAKETTSDPSSTQTDAEPTPLSRTEFVLNDDGSFTEETQGSQAAAEPVDEGMTPLRTFLQTSSLSTDTETSESEKDDDSAKVTVSTCHAAKGLEWPVIFIPSVEQGTFPFYRTDDSEEERRLLYVACTRAQSYLYLTHAQSRMTGGEAKERERSVFITAVVNKTPTTFSAGLPSLTRQELVTVSQVLARPLPSDLEILRLIDESNYSQPAIKSRRYSSRPESHEDLPPIESASVGFQSASLLPNSSFGHPRMSHGSNMPRVAPLPQTTIIQSSSHPPHQRPLLASQKPNTLQDPLSQTTVPKPKAQPGIKSFFAKPANIPSVREPSAGPSSLPLVGKQGAERHHNLHSATKGGRTSNLVAQNPQTSIQPAVRSRAEENVSVPQAPVPVVKLAAGKRRLGMGRAPDGFNSQPLKRPRTG